MSKQIFSSGVVIINSVDLSDHVESLAIDFSAPQVDVTAMGATARQYLAGFRDDSIDITFWQDFAASSVHATLFPLFNGGSLVSVKFAANVAPYSSANPTFSGTAVITDYPPMSGKVGDGLQAVVKMKPNGALTAGTS